MNLHRISALGIVSFLGLGLAAGGCTASASISAGPSINGCNADSSLDCSGGAWGYACDAGDNPEDEDATLSCSTPVADGTTGGDDYCCYSFSGGSSTTCSADDGLTAACPDPDSYGYVCAAANDDPTSLDGNLNCSQGVPDADGTSTDFCCTYGSGGGGGGGGGGACGLDSSVDCSGSGTDGYSCPAGDNPENDDPSLSCSDPTPNGSDDDFCCIAWSGTTSTCAPDDSVTDACPDPDSYGYSCAAGDDPTSLDPSLNCSNATPDGANDDFCCTL